MSEKLRQMIRNRLGWNSRLYRFGAEFIKLLAICRQEGVTVYWQLYNCAKGQRTAPPISVKLHGLNHAIKLRPGTEDAETIINNVIRAEYAHIAPPANPRWMIDAGAYIGDTSTYFLSHYPTLNVIALEPDAQSFQAAQENLQPYGQRVKLLQKGLWGSDTTLRFGGDETSASIRDTGQEIECVSIPTIMKQFQISKIDILKMDIEGAEKELFSANPAAWLPLVDLIIIEIHGPTEYQVIKDALDINNFTMTQYRSLWFCQPAERRR